MYWGTDGKEMRSISVPVLEAPWPRASLDWTVLPEGTHLEIQVEQNPWKEKLEQTKYQVVIGALLSFWSAFLIIFGVFRILQFYFSENSFSIFSIGPICLLLEVVAATIRFIHTIVDPFWVARIYPTQLSNALTTIHVPILFASGILITFFCTIFPNLTRLRAQQAVFTKSPNTAADFLLACSFKRSTF